MNFSKCRYGTYEFIFEKKSTMKNIHHLTYLLSSIVLYNMFLITSHYQVVRTTSSILPTKIEYFKNQKSTCARLNRTTGPLSPHRFEACAHHQTGSCTPSFKAKSTISFYVVASITDEVKRFISNDTRSRLSRAQY